MLKKLALITVAVSVIVTAAAFADTPPSKAKVPSGKPAAAAKTTPIQVPSFSKGMSQPATSNPPSANPPSAVAAPAVVPGK